MKKILILSGIAMLCLLGQTTISSASATLETTPGMHFKVKKGKHFDTVNWYYSNSNAFSVLVTFWQYGHPASVFTVPAGYSSGSFSVVPGTYNVEFAGSGSMHVISYGYGDLDGSDVTFSNVVFSANSETSFTIDLPQ